MSNEEAARLAEAGGQADQAHRGLRLPGPPDHDAAGHEEELKRRMQAGWFAFAKLKSS